MSHSSLVRNVLYPLQLRRRGELRTLDYLREYTRTQYASADELRSLQTARLRSLMSHAYERCDFYRGRFDAAGIRPSDIRELEDLRGLPPLEKADIQRDGARMIAKGWPTADLIRNQTGGSTGTPIVFHLCRDRKMSRAAATMRHDAWAGRVLGDTSAVIWGAPLDRPSSSIKETFRRWLLREPLWLDTAGLTEETFTHFRRELCRLRPRTVQAYSQSAVLFAKWLDSNRLDVPPLAGLIATAEVLTDDDRALLERIFRTRVFNRYGCREVSVIASECEAHSGMHVMAEGLFVEIEGPNGPASPGEVGSILVTDLLNPAMPLIRYRIGDMAAFASGSCRCGRHLPRLERLAGRVTDFLVGQGGRLVSGVFLATYVVAQRPSLGQVRIVQTREGEVTYECVPGPGFDRAADLAYLEAATREHLGAETAARLSVVASLERAASGKFVFSSSTVRPTWLGKSDPPRRAFSAVAAR